MNKPFKVLFMNLCNLSMRISAIANVIADNMSDEELELAAAAFVQLGDTLGTISILRSRCDTQDKSDT